MGKPTGCAACGRNFTVRMLFDPQVRRWSPKITYLPAATETPAKPGEQRAWFTVACRCGHKIGLDSRFVGRNMTCKACHRQFTVKLVEGDSGNDTAIIRYSRVDASAAAPGENPRTELRKRAETARGRTVTKPPVDPPTKSMIAPPNEMHLLCICGEELTVEKKYFNDKLCCGGCGTVMQLRLIFVPDRNKYELEARVVDPRAES